MVPVGMVILKKVQTVQILCFWGQTVSRVSGKFFWPEVYAELGVIRLGTVTAPYEQTSYKGLL